MSVAIVTNIDAMSLTPEDSCVIRGSIKTDRLSMQSYWMIDVSDVVLHQATSIPPKEHLTVVTSHAV